MSNPLTCYTDGAYKRSLDKGGWGAVWWETDFPKVQYLLYGGENSTTNQRMELTAILQALMSMPKSRVVQLYSDSAYCLHGIVKDYGTMTRNGWMESWKRCGWTRGQSGGEVKNLNLWKAIDEAITAYETSGGEVWWYWVKGHSGDPGNDLADDLSNRWIQETSLRP